MTNRPSFEALYAAAMAENHTAAIYVCMDAESNAATTVFEEKEAPESDLDRIALASICETTVFQEDEAARAWFEAKGYRW